MSSQPPSGPRRVHNGLVGKRSRKRTRGASGGNPDGSGVAGKPLYTPPPQAPRVDEEASEALDLPDGIKGTFERAERLFPLLRAGRTPEELIREKADEATKLLARFDAVHVLAHVLMGEAMFDPDRYVESESRGVAYNVELATALLIARPSRRGTEDYTPAIEAHTLGPARESLGDMALLEGLRRYAKAGGYESPLGAARGRAATHHLMLRGPAWPWQENRLLTDLFGAQHIARRLEDALGFTAAVAVRCVEAVPKLISERMSRHMQGARDADHEPAYEWAAKALRGWQDAPATEEFRRMAIKAVWALNHLGDALCFSPADLAQYADVDVSETEALLAALSASFGSQLDLFAAAEHVRDHPYLDVGDGTFFCTVPGNDLWALRRLFEGTLAEGEQYQRHRGRWLERRASELLSGALSPDATWHNVRLMPKGGGAQLGEIDVLIRVGDTALVIEAKGASLRAGARRGGESLVDHLKKHLGKAASQSSLALQALRNEIDIELRDDAGKLLDVGDIREVHPIVVTLEDHSAVSPTLWQIAGTEVLPDGVSIPLVLSVYELEHLARLIEWPPQFIHYLRRRSRLNDRADRLATEELDWWMLYLETSLYFEHEPDGPVRRYLSQTDALDAWVLHDQGMRKRAAPKPRQRLDQDSRDFLTLLSEERPPGWIAAGCSLLDVSHESRRALQKDMSDARRSARSRGKVQRGTMGFQGVPGDLLIIWVVVADDGASVLADQLADYVDDRLTEWGLQRGLGIGLTAGSRRSYDALVVVERSIRSAVQA